MTINIFGIKLYIRKSTVAVIIAIIIVAIGIIVEAFLSKSETIDLISEETAQRINNISTPKVNTPTPDTTEYIKVYVTGAVMNPGIVTIAKGQIIEDALNQAGGVTEDADVTSINRVFKLKENVMLYVKSKNELQKQVDQSVEKTWSQSQDAGPGISIINDSGGSILGGGVTAGIQKKININTATDAEFDTLPGIGKETAKTIVEFRNKNGDFKDIKDIMKIPGIKESRFNSIKDLISVD